MTRLEIYGVVLLLLVAAVVGAYFKGRADMEHKIETEQLAANAQALEAASKAASARAVADDAARAKAQQFMVDIDQGIANARAKFDQLVATDARGCQRINDAGRLRWNAIELLPAGSALDPASIPPQPVPAGAVPPP